MESAGILLLGWLLTALFFMLVKAILAPQETSPPSVELKRETKQVYIHTNGNQKLEAELNQHIESMTNKTMTKRGATIYVVK